MAPQRRTRGTGDSHHQSGVGRVSRRDGNPGEVSGQGVVVRFAQVRRDQREHLGQARGAVARAGRVAVGREPLRAKPGFAQCDPDVVLGTASRASSNPGVP